MMIFNDQDRSGGVTPPRMSRSPEPFAALSMTFPVLVVKVHCWRASRANSSLRNGVKQRRRWDGRDKLRQQVIVNGDARSFQRAEENPDDWFKAAMYGPHFRRDRANFFNDCIRQQ